MAACAKLESILGENEIKSLAEGVRNKIEDYLTRNYQFQEELKNQNSELQAVSERQQFQFEKEIFENQARLKESTESCVKLKSQVVDQETQLNSLQQKWRDLQRTHDTVLLELQTTKRNNELLSQEKKDLAEQLEKRRNDIEKLNDELKTLLKKVTTSNEEKYEALAKAEEAQMKESNLQHQVKRLEQEKELLNKQIDDLNVEVSQKNHEIHTLKREKSTNVLELQTQLEHRIEELHMVQSQVTDMKKAIEEKDRRIEALAERIRGMNQSQSEAEEQYQLELRAQTKLVDLYKRSSEDAQERVQEMVRAVEEMQKLLQEATESQNKFEERLSESENQWKTLMGNKDKELVKLRDELKNVNDLLSQNKGLSPERLETMFPTAAATSKVLRSGMTLTQMYSEYIKSQEELQVEKNENIRLNQQLQQIVAEIEDNTPVITQRMQEYHKSIETISCLRSQLAGALTDQERLQSERDDAKRLSGQLERENNRLRRQTEDLNHQVRVLLKEVEEARGGHVRLGSRRKEDQEVSSSDEITASKVISRHLVTFRDIEEIQAKNQQLLTVVRELSEQQEEQEKKATQEKTAELQKELEISQSQLDELRKDRVKQAEMVETIVRQRDMYRVLLANQGFSPSLLGSPPTSSTPLPGLQGSLSPGDSRLHETKNALKQLQHEFDSYKKEKAENTKMLNEQLEKMRDEVSDLRIQNAKLSSQLEYSEERFSLLQSNLENYKREANALREKNQKHTLMITQHQQTINTLRQDIMVTHEKLAKAEVGVENMRAERDLLKSVETRLLQEKESVLREQQHQSRVLANLQAVQNNLDRIESERQRSLQYQVEKFEKECAMLRAKLENENEEYRSAVKIWEKQTQDLQQKVDKEIERNRKLHEDLVDAYAQVHELKQELSSARAKVISTEAQIEKKIVTESAGKTAVPTVTPSEVKNLKDQLNEAKNKIKGLQEKLDLTQKSSEHYLSMATDLELRVKEQDEINQQLKDTMEKMLQQSNEARADLEKNLEEMEKTNRKLTEENMHLSQDQSSKFQELQKQIASLDKQLETSKNQTEENVKIASQAREDCQTQLKLMQEAQDKYERELMLHAEDVKLLTSLKEEQQQYAEKLEQLTQTTRHAEQELTDSKASWVAREQLLLEEKKSVENRNKDLQTQNESLHQQLEIMGSQMAALQPKKWNEDPVSSSSESSTKDTHHFLQVIQFLKREKEIASTQYDAAQSENIRLKMKLDQVTNQLNEAKSELKDLEENSQTKAASDAQHSELLRKIEMLNMLTESNRQLRSEKDSLLEIKEQHESKILELEKQLQPLQEANKEMSSQVEVYSTENLALRGEVKSWQSRTNQLLEQSHKIGPQEYKNLTKVIEELKRQKVMLAEELQKKQTDVSQLNASLAAMRKDLESARNEIVANKLELEKAKQEMGKVNDDNLERQKTILQVKKIARKYKTQYDELKVLHDELTVKATEMSSEGVAQEQVQEKQAEAQKKFQEGEKRIKELMDEVEKLKEQVAKVSKDEETVRNQATEKEERARKLMAHVRQKLSQLNNHKDTLVKENHSLLKQNDEQTSQITNLKKDKEEANLRHSTLKSQFETKLTRLEKELKTAKETVERLEKQNQELNQKIVQQKQSTKPTAAGGLVDRGSVSSSEPLTANIKPLATPAQASGTGVGLRHTSHPHAAVPSARSTPTASIRPMAIGTVASSSAAAAASSQTRMAAVLPTTATITVSADEDILPVPCSSQPPAVPQATVQPTPATPTATATVAPTTVAATVTPSSHTPVISEVPPTAVVSAVGEVQVEVIPTPGEPVQSHLISSAGSNIAAPATALVSPRIEGSDGTTEIVPEAPAPTTSVIVSPPATQTQVVTPTVKRKRDELDTHSSSDSQEGTSAIPKKVRMVSEGSQTNQQLTATNAPPSNVAVVSAATVVSREGQSEETTVLETSTVMPPSQTASAEDKHLIETDVPIASHSGAETIPEEASETTVDKERESLIVEVEDSEVDNAASEIQERGPKVDFEEEGMEEVEDPDREFEDVEQMQVVTCSSRTGDDEDMPEDSVEDREEMEDQPSDNELEIDVGDSDENPMDADSSSQQAPPSDHCMAPPAHPVPQESVRTEGSHSASLTEGIQTTTGSSQRPPLLPRILPRQERLPSVGRQSLPSVTIQGHGSAFEEDDSIVPSTPTLFVPRRADGFAEIVSSPHIPPGRFLFSSSESSHSQQGLSQLATQGALGMDDTNMDLSQFDEGGGRSVPSTPLQVSPPAVVSSTEVPDTVTMEQPTSPSVGEASVPSIASQIIPIITVEAEDDTLILNISEVPEQIEKSCPSKSTLPVPSIAIESSQDAESEPKVSEDVEKSTQQPQTVITSVSSEGAEESSTTQLKSPASGDGTSSFKQEEETIEGDKEQSQGVFPQGQVQQRKPIVWQEGDTGSNSPSPTTSQQQFPSPPSRATGQRSTRSQRGRRIRLRGSGGFPRGSPSAWGGSRRGHGSSRKSHTF